MKLHVRSIYAGLASCALLVVLFALAPVRAQMATAPPAALPTAPGAERAVNGGLSQAHASLPGGAGLSPLEPYLILWLLPVSGLLVIAAGFYVDRSMLKRDPRRKAVPYPPRGPGLF